MGHTDNALNVTGQYPYLADIPGSSSWLQLAEVDTSEKDEHVYAVLDQSDQRYVLKLVPTTTYDRAKHEFQYLKTIRSLGIMVPAAVGFGFCGKGRSLYLQTGWVDGQPLCNRIASLSGASQYALGTDAGLYLKKIHQIPLEGQPEMQKGQFQARYRKALGACRLCRGHLAGERKLFRLIMSALHDLESRPAVLLHGNFIPDSILLSPYDQLGLAGFKDWIYGDPLYDLANSLTWFRSVSLPFAIGILDCYFAFQISIEIFQLMSAYAALDLIERFAAAQKEDETAVQAVQRQAEILCQDYPGEGTRKPSWYKIMRNARLA
jgi:aminoglycoside phosphotransferase (APT) family kinase protein